MLPSEAGVGNAKVVLDIESVSFKRYWLILALGY
jgi:hypothetical protein